MIQKEKLKKKSGNVNTKVFVQISKTVCEKKIIFIRHVIFMKLINLLFYSMKLIYTFNYIYLIYIFTLYKQLKNP